MIIFPAIDIKDGVCVRLIKGDYRQITTYENTPIDQATKYFENGFNKDRKSTRLNSSHT